MGYEPSTERFLKVRYRGPFQRGYLLKGVVRVMFRGLVSGPDSGLTSGDLSKGLSSESESVNIRNIKNIRQQTTPIPMLSIYGVRISKIRNYERARLSLARHR